MKLRFFAVLLVLIAACGDDDAVTTTTSSGTGTTATTVGITTGTTVVETSTTTAPLPLTDPRFPETNMSARFTGSDGEPVDVGFDPSSLLALFYRSPDEHLVVVITGFDPAVTQLQCGWAYVDYGPESVLGENWYTASFSSFGNQPFATDGATGEPRCEEEFLEDGTLRSDIVTAQQCGDYLVFSAPDLILDPADVGEEVAVPSVELVVELSGGGVTDLEAIPWVAHPGANQTTADLLELDLATVDCAA